MEAEGEEEQDKSAEDKGRDHPQSIWAEGESAGPVKSRRVDGIPTQPQQEVVLQDGQDDKHGRKDQGPE